MAQKTIYFENGAVGEFRTLHWPRADGVYEYMPYRSGSHLRMHERLRESGSAQCHCEGDGQMIRFTVVGCPKYGHLQCAQFAFETHDT